MLPIDARVEKGSPVRADQLSVKGSDTPKVAVLETPALLAEISARGGYSFLRPRTSVFLSVQYSSPERPTQSWGHEVGLTSLKNGWEVVVNGDGAGSGGSVVKRPYAIFRLDSDARRTGNSLEDRRNEDIRLAKLFAEEYKDLLKEQGINPEHVVGVSLRTEVTENLHGIRLR